MEATDAPQATKKSLLPKIYFCHVCEDAMPCSEVRFWAFCRVKKPKNKFASAGNRTRAARVAGEHSTTEPPMLWD
ncbi:hypothetical protein L596_027072 [Steinernema carpocapsae]|uniref:Uncharacterized protein n=1 Tax=Steinernema carpocapsae TaxID=34508 RepID=A0A4U5M391_STECR|nr:hypothetical protein L596_027072 [Steinernema carpocapsae]